MLFLDLIYRKYILNWNRQLENVFYSQMTSQWNTCLCDCERGEIPSADRGQPEMDIKKSQKPSRFKLKNKISLRQILPLNQKMKTIQLLVCRPFQLTIWIIQPKKATIIQHAISNMREKVFSRSQRSSKIAFFFFHDKWWLWLTKILPQTMKPTVA